MKRKTLLVFGLLLSFGISFAQTNHFEKISFIIRDWTGIGSGFGNNESIFEPIEKNPKGEHHIDKGFISFDERRNSIIFRQYNNEGYYNQYALNDSASNENLLIFKTEFIENFVPNGKAKWTIKRSTNMKWKLFLMFPSGKTIHVLAPTDLLASNRPNC